MQELHSSAALDEEIRLDARRKAESILKKADEECVRLTEGVMLRVEDAVRNAENASKERLAVYAKNINASLPLEKQRYSITFIRDSVLNQINEYLRNLGEEKKFAVISNMLEKTKYALAGKKVIAKLVNLDSKKAEQLLKKENTFELVKCESSDSRIIEDEKLEGLEVREGIVLCAEDNSVTVRLTFDEKVKQILDEKNLELSTALFGRRIPE